jgi:CrcB protein
VIKTLYIALGGAVGTLCRYLVGVGLARALPGKMPWGTLAVNVVGSFIIGVVMALFAERDALDSQLRMALTIGFLGGFTTYSAFAFEVVTLAKDGELATLGLYLTLLLALSLGGCLAGIALGRLVA